MASSKSYLLLFCALLALVLLVSAEVTTSHDAKDASVSNAEVDQYGHRHPGDRHGGGCRHGCCRYYRHRHGCRRCCRSADEAPDAEFEDDTRN